jgi:hypothetical protein
MGKAPDSRSEDNSHLAAHCISPEVIEWAEFLLRGGSLELIPASVQAEASTVAEAASILGELYDLE